MKKIFTDRFSEDQFSLDLNSNLFLIERNQFNKYLDILHETNSLEESILECTLNDFNQIDLETFNFNDNIDKIILIPCHLNDSIFKSVYPISVDISKKQHDLLSPWQICKKIPLPISEQRKPTIKLDSLANLSYNQNNGYLNLNPQTKIAFTNKNRIKKLNIFALKNDGSDSMEWYCQDEYFNIYKH